ncbi:MAG: DUF2752 domain-containing protein [Alphaproteobacteria bacterium]|nr:DUF2752 domain-containing protein [Alphaproteobacteria bacterium]
MAGLSNRYLWGEVIIAVVLGGIVLAAALLAPSDEVVSLFGYEIPVMCGFRRITGFGCPGCGLTRSFAFMAHGDVISAFQMNWLGPFLFTAFATQPPYRAWVIGRELWSRRSRIQLEEV